MNFTINQDQLLFSIYASDFKKLQDYEKNNNFFEKDGGSSFFRKGVTNDWLNKLNKSQVIKIEKELGNEMNILGYKRVYYNT
jgi:hypothetical protein